MVASLVDWDVLIRFEPSGESGVYYGEPVLDGSRVEDIDELVQQGRLTAQVLEGSDALSARRSNKVKNVERLLGPLQAEEVPIIHCIGLNYKTHILETGRPLPSCPTIFTKPGPSVASHGENIPIPAIAQSQCDYEGELVVLMGKDAKNLSEVDAMEYVAAYTIGNDISSRDWQRDVAKAGPVPQWTFSKSFDKYAPVGPCLMAAHVLGDRASALPLKPLVNGEVRQESNPSDLLFDVAKLVAFCSQGQTLQRGSLIMTGTPGRVGLFTEPPVFLKDGDRVDVEIGYIGRLSNRIKFEANQCDLVSRGSGRKCMAEQ